MAVWTRFSRSFSLRLKQHSVLQRLVWISSLHSKADPPKDKAKDEGTTTSINTTKSETHTYKVQEYFNYNPHSYYDIEMEMVKFRLEQPVPGVKY